MLDRPTITGAEPDSGMNRLESLQQTFNDYLALTKPPILTLLVLTAIGGLFVAAEGVPPLVVTLLVCLGGALGAGGANTLNHYLDQDIDSKMSRTVKRPIPGNRVSPRKALIFGILLNVAAFAILGYWVNLLAASLTLSATLFYVFVYTMWLKRTTPQNIVIGGAAGSIPPMVGWVAITGSLDLPALYMFSIVFFWTPPHFWALAFMIRDDYADAGVPMLPVVSTSEHTALHIFLYSLVLVAISVVFAATSAVSWVYLGTAAVLGVVFIAMAWRLLKESTVKRAKPLYLFSLLYLALLFVAMMVDSVVPI